MKESTRKSRPARVSVALSPEELEAIDRRARKLGLSRSDILRTAARPDAMNVGGAIDVDAGPAHFVFGKSLDR